MIKFSPTHIVLQKYRKQLLFKHIYLTSTEKQVLTTYTTLFPARWHSKHTYLSSLGMLGTTQLDSIFFSDHITFNNGYMKRTHTRQRMTMIITKIIKKFDILTLNFFGFEW